nr:hypothetical protein [Tanacetum cinerariifolium]
GENVSSSTGSLLTGNLLSMYTPRGGSLPSDLKIVEWHSYKHLEWITVRRDDDKLYKFKEGYFKRLRLQDIEDMLLILVQGELSNLTVEERFAFNVSLRMFTRSIVIQRPKRSVYCLFKPKRIHLSKRGQEKQVDADRFSDGTLNDVRNALDDRLKGIRVHYLPQTICRIGDKDRATAMIQAIDKMLKTRRIMRSLEREVGCKYVSRHHKQLVLSSSSWKSAIKDPALRSSNISNMFIKEGDPIIEKVDGNDRKEYLEQRAKLIAEERLLIRDKSRNDHVVQA